MREGARTGRGLRVLLAGNFAPDEQQSMLRFEGMLARGLVERGHEVRSISPRPRFARLARPYRYGGWPKLLGYVDKLVLFPPVLARTVREFAPDVVHVVDQGNAGYGRAVAGVPVVGTCHDLLAARIALGELGRGGTGVAGGYWQRRILRSLARMNHVACVSEQTRRDLTRLAGMGPERTSVVPNGLNYPYRRCSEGEARGALGGRGERSPANNKRNLSLSQLANNSKGGQTWQTTRYCRGQLLILAILRRTGFGGWWRGRYCTRRRR